MLTKVARDDRWARIRVLLLTAAILSATATYSGATVAAATDATAHPSELARTYPVLPWNVWNYTDRQLTAGEVYKQQGDRTSSITFGEASEQPALEVGQQYTAMQRYDVWTTAKMYTWGRVCYDHTWWNLRRDNPRFGWDDVYIFAFDNGHGGKKLVANPRGAHEDIPMIPTDRCSTAAPTLTGSPTPAVTGTAYNYAFTVTGTPAPTVTVTAGTLPAGLTLSTDGVLSGTPTQTGAFPITLTATNGTAPDATLPTPITITSDGDGCSGSLCNGSSIFGS